MNIQCRVRACGGAEMAKLTTFRACQTQQGIDSQSPPAVMWDEVNLDNYVVIHQVFWQGVCFILQLDVSPCRLVFLLSLLEDVAPVIVTAQCCLTSVVV